VAKGELKTVRNDASVADLIAGVANEERRRDTQVVVDLMAEITGQPPVMWGTSIVGFGSYRYRYASGREGEWMRIGVSPRKQSVTLYLLEGFGGHAELLSRLGKHSTGKSCLHIERLAEVDEAVLRELITRSWQHGTPMGAV
jgi:hypothetical protein